MSSAYGKGEEVGLAGERTDRVRTPADEVPGRAQGDGIIRPGRDRDGVRKIGGRQALAVVRGAPDDDGAVVFKREGMRVPLSGEVAWLLPSEEGGCKKPYWRGTIRSLSYEWTPY